MESYHIERLDKLAKYISEVGNELWYMEPQAIFFFHWDSQNAFEAFYHRWALYELPWIFREWYYRGENNVYDSYMKEWFIISDVPVHSLAGRDQGTVWSCLFFFGLDEEQFLHLFGAGNALQQPEKFGGITYPEPDDTYAIHITINIQCLIKKLQND